MYDVFWQMLGRRRLPFRLHRYSRLHGLCEIPARRGNRVSMEDVMQPIRDALGHGEKPSGSNLVLNCTDDRGKYRAASATGDDL